MSSILHRLGRDRRGNALIIIGATLPLVVGSAGLATDTIQWTMWQRQLQRAADSAAFAGTYARVQGHGVNAAVSADLATNNHVGIALQSGYPQIGYPANTTAYNNAVSVSLAVRKDLSFSGMFVNSPLIRVNATAAYVHGDKYCVISLEETTTTGISFSGSATVNMGCGMATNSVGAAAIDGGGSGTVNASPLAARGNVPASSMYVAGTVRQPYSLRQEDPFASLNPPPAPSGSCPQLNVQPTATVTGQTGGCFASLDIKGTISFQDNAVIYVDGGDIKFGSQANVSCNGCVFVLTNKSTSANAPIGTLDIAGGATVNLVAPQTGTYKGMLFYQDRRASETANVENKINGNSSSKFEGAFYFPRQKSSFTGTSGMNTTCMQIVAKRVTFSGNTNISNSCPTNSGAGAFNASAVKLIA